jgi:hypothetical protein
MILAKNPKTKLEKIHRIKKEENPRLTKIENPKKINLIFLFGD